MKKIYAYSFVFLSALILIAGTAFTTQEKPAERTNKDIIKFSHSFHAEVTDCASCHTNVVESTSLSDKLLPTMDACAECHDVEDMDACGTCHYEEVFEPLLQNKSDIIFSHKFHAGEKEVECVECHKGFADVDYGFETTQPNPSMMQCSTCHNNQAVATSECSACHSVTDNLFPQDHRTATFFDNHKFSAMSANANCAMCHDNVFCEDCHVATTGIDGVNLSDDFYTPYSTHKYLNGAKEQVITRVHDLNFRYMHGIEAKSKSMECQTCHQTETFCAECHSSASEDFAAEGIVPTSHLQQGFVMIGVGSGGGVHSKLARRDIESCASCHDVQGTDPNCILCHVDTDGIRGTNPKTHDINFMGDIEGSWHEDAGAVCYNCHTDANAHPGGNQNIGFCAYCHNN